MRVADSLCYLEAPLQAWIYVRRERATSVEANLVLLRRDGTRPDGEIKFLLIEDGRIEGDAPRVDRVLQRLEDFWLNMRANWTPGPFPRDISISSSWAT